MAWGALARFARFARFASAGVLLGLVARAWLATLRVRVVVHPALAEHGARPWVLSFFHGTQWPLLAWRRRRATVVLVSLSRDGAMQGLNIAQTVALAEAVAIPVIASGGLASLDDVKRLLQPDCARLAGAISGRALYDGRLDPAEALALLKGAATC